MRVLKPQYLVQIYVHFELALSPRHSELRVSGHNLEVSQVALRDNIGEKLLEPQEEHLSLHLAHILKLLHRKLLGPLRFLIRRLLREQQHRRLFAFQKTCTRQFLIEKRRVQVLDFLSQFFGRAGGRLCCFLV